MNDFSFLKAIRFKKNLKLYQFASKLGLSIGYLNQIENGKIIPSSRMKNKILESLNKMGGLK